MIATTMKKAHKKVQMALPVSKEIKANFKIEILK